VLANSAEVAVAVHVRTRVLHNLAFPLTYLLLAIGSLILAF